MQICEIKEMIQGPEFGLVGIPVGTADSDGALLQPKNFGVLHAADHVHVNVYPFWGGVDIAGAREHMIYILTQLRDILRRDSDGDRKVIAIGETGWPSVGTNGLAHGNVGNAERYWREVGCWLHVNGVPWVWFSGVDEPWKPDMGGVGGAEQNFGVMKVGSVDRKFEMKC